MKSLLPILVFTATLAAQKMPLASDPTRIVQVIDASAHVGTAATPTAARERLATLATFLRDWAGAPLPGDVDVQTLGDRHLVVLGSAQQQAAVEALFAHAIENQDRQILVAARICTIPDATYQAQFASLLPAPREAGNGQSVGVLTADAAADLTNLLGKAEGVDTLICPSVVTLPLQPATMHAGEKIPFVKDHVVRTIDGRTVIDPVTDATWDGIEISALCSLTPKDDIILQFGLVTQQVQRPLTTFRTTLPGSTTPVEIQLPRIDGVRANHKALLQTGQTVVVAAQRQDGAWVMTLTKATVVR